MKTSVGRHFCMTCKGMRWFKKCECNQGVCADEKTRFTVCETCNSIFDEISWEREMLEEKRNEIDDLKGVND